MHYVLCDMCYPLCYVISILQCMLCGMHYMLSTIYHVSCAMHNVLCAMPYVSCATHSHDRCYVCTMYVLCITCYALYMHYVLCMMCSVRYLRMRFSLSDIHYALCAMCYAVCAMPYALCYPRCINRYPPCAATVCMACPELPLGVVLLILNGSLGG